MKLLDLQNGETKVWEEKGYLLPKYDREELKKKTKENPTWVHFGAGNIFRAFPAAKLQDLLNLGEYDRGVVVAESFDHEIITKAYKPYDGLSLSVVLKAEGTIEKHVVGSVTESLVADPVAPEDYARLTEIFENPSLQMVTFTITEKGYSLVNGKGEKLPGVEDGFLAGPGNQSHLMGRIASLCYARFVKNGTPLALVSTDNCSHNGDKLYAAILAFAKAWAENGKAEKEFVEYIDSNKVSFTWSMIDKITPRPDASVEKILLNDGVEELDPVITSKNTYVAPFVNAEETEYLVIEDDFPNGRLDLTKGGLMFTDRDTVDKVEKMKVCTCLNPLHTCLAIFGCVLGYNKISDEMKDEELVKLVETVGYKEGLPVVVNPGILDPKEFIDTVLKVRVPNPFMPDTPQRIATDTSQKIVVRFGETMKSYMASSELDCSSLVYIPLAIAGWLRYLLGTDDKLEKMELSSDPMLAKLQEKLSGVEAGKPETYTGQLKEILTNKAIFGVDMYEAGLADKVEGMFVEMLAGKDAVRNTLKKYVD